MNQIKELAEKYGTPLYLFDSDAVKKRIAGIKKIFPENTILCYAIKANPFLVEPLKDEDLLFEVCSPGELSICEKAGLSPDKIVFSGVCKTAEDVERAYKLKVKTITLESPLHCRYLLDAVKKLPVHPQEVILRLTSGNQFGMSSEDIDACIQEIKKEPSVKIRGIHYFTGTQKKQKKIQEETLFIQDYCKNLKEKHSIDFSQIEYGPGLSYEYFSDTDQSENFSEAQLFADEIRNSPWTFVIELGRYIASCCGTYITKIMDVKKDGDSTYVIIDGGINHINYYGQMMGMKNPKVIQIKESSEIQNSTDSTPCTICGSLCTTADVVLRKLELSAPEYGDLLAFKDIGAYSITEGIYLFLSHPLPAVVLKQNSAFTLLRNHKETFIINSKDSR